MMTSFRIYTLVGRLLLVGTLHCGLDAVAEETFTANMADPQAQVSPRHLRDRARDGNVAAILALGRQGSEDDQAWLSAQLARSREGSAPASVVRALRKAAARLGDEACRDEILADLKSENRYMQRSAVEDACYVEGADMIAGLARMLYDGRAGGRPMEYDESGVPVRRSPDEYIAAPRHSAVVALSRLVKDESAPVIDPDRSRNNEENVVAWRQWWEANRGKYLSAE